MKKMFAALASLLLLALVSSCSSPLDNIKPVLAAEDMAELKTLPQGVAFNDLNPAQQAIARKLIRKAFQDLYSGEFANVLCAESNNNIGCLTAMNEMRVNAIAEWSRIENDENLRKEAGKSSPAVSVAFYSCVKKILTKSFSMVGQSEAEKQAISIKILEEVIKDFGLTPAEFQILAEKIAKFAK